MHYYKFHIGDYKRSTDHLTNEEDIAYRRLLDMYYETERPIPLETQSVARRLRVGKEIIEIVLNEFFIRTGEGYQKEYCDAVMREYHAKVSVNRANGKSGGRPKATPALDENPLGSQSVAKHNPVVTLTTNHKPLIKEGASSDALAPNEKKLRGSGTRLDPDWLCPSDWLEIGAKLRSDLDIESVADSFKDYWVGVPGAKGTKLDWLATWRYWVRGQRAAFNKPLANSTSNKFAGAI